MVKILFFASLREQLGTGELVLDEFLGDIAALRETLIAAHPRWRPLLSADNIRTALNQQLADLRSPVADGDEVAFFPPVTGG